MPLENILFRQLRLVLEGFVEFVFVGVLFPDKLWNFPKGMCSPAVFWSHTGIHNVMVAWFSRHPWQLRIQLGGVPFVGLWHPFQMAINMAKNRWGAHPNHVSVRPGMILQETERTQLVSIREFFVITSVAEEDSKYQRKNGILYRCRIIHIYSAVCLNMNTTTLGGTFFDFKSSIHLFWKAQLSLNPGSIGLAWPRKWAQMGPVTELQPAFKLYNKYIIWMPGSWKTLVGIM